MNFNQLRYFVAIVKHGSFWSAALEEYISQSSLSKQIKALETELGVVLFNRTGNKITLTEAGQCFYDYALQLLETKNEMHQELMAFEDTPIEEVKFASIPIVSSYKISTLLSEFQKVNKNRRQVVNYNILEEEQKDVLMLLKNDKVDFAFVGVVLHDTMKKTILGLSQEKRFMAGKSYRRGEKGHGKKNIRWNFIYMYWIFFDDCFNKNDFCG